LETNIHIPFCSPLRDYVSAIWEAKAGRNCRETILPQGAVEIIFNFTDQVTAQLPHSTEIMTAPRCFIQGVHTHVVQANYIGDHHLLGLRLHPHKVKELLGIMPSELKNKTFDFSLFRKSFNELWYQLNEAKTFIEKITLIENSFSVNNKPSCQRSQALSHLFVSGGIESFHSVNALAKEVCYSTRQLNRVTNNLFGISAEELTVYKKFMQSVQHMHSANISLTDVAYSSGFYDQAHFCRVFKSYTGLTAKHYKDNKSATPFHIFS
jgi:AraC-like DNA-binding protein